MMAYVPYKGVSGHLNQYPYHFYTDVKKGRSAVRVVTQLYNLAIWNLHIVKKICRVFKICICKWPVQRMV